MFENLTEKLERSFKIIKGQGRITEINIAETLKEVRRALLDADVSYRVAKDFCNDVKAKALGQNVLTAVRPDQMMIKIVHDELVTLMGSTATDINIKGKPGIVLVAGLQGSGKTTFCGKLALSCKSKRGLKVMLVAGDVYRPAAIDQLKVLGGQTEVFVYAEDGVKDPVKIAKNAIAYAAKENYSLVIIDTAGRLAVDEEMMDEIAAIKEAVRPTETLFVVDAMTGQDAVETAKAFNDRRSRPWSTSRSSSSAPARRWRPSMSSIPTVSPTVSWVWAMWFPSWRRLRNSMMSRRPASWQRSWQRISSICGTSTSRSSRSRRWATSRILHP